MTTIATRTPPQADFELHFASLFDPGRALSFPCDYAGSVNLDALNERTRLNYFYALVATGRDFAWPCVQAL